MKIIEITKEEIINYLSNKENIIGQGSYGILYKYNDTTLIKLYYKEFIDTYFNLDSKTFEKEIEGHLQIIEIFKQYKMEYIDKLDKLKKLHSILQLTDCYDLIKGVVTYKNHPVGVLLEYYKNYKTLGEIYFYLSKKEKIIVLEKVKRLLENLMENNIYYKDVKENNFMVNTETLDVKIIDLDGNEVRIEEKSYVEKHTSVKKECVDYYNYMVRKLNKNTFSD